MKFLKKNFKKKNAFILVDGYKKVFNHVNSLNLKKTLRIKEINKKLTEFLESETAHQFESIQQGTIGKSINLTTDDKKIFNNIILGKTKEIAQEDTRIGFLQLLEHHILPKVFGESAHDKRKNRNQLHFDIPNEIINSDANKCIQFKWFNHIMKHYSKNEFVLRTRTDNLNPDYNFGRQAC